VCSYPHTTLLKDTETHKEASVQLPTPKDTVTPERSREIEREGERETNHIISGATETIDCTVVIPTFKLQWRVQVAIA